jgi:hypothetical protein
MESFELKYEVPNMLNRPSVLIQDRKDSELPPIPDCSNEILRSNFNNPYTDKDEPQRIIFLKDSALPILDISSKLNLLPRYIKPYKESEEDTLDVPLRLIALPHKKPCINDTLDPILHIP